MTSLACIRRVNKFDRNTQLFSFVCNEFLELKKAPTCYHPVQMLVPSFRFLSNMSQPFHADQSAIVPLCFFDNLLRNNVIFVSNSSVLFSGEALQNLFRSIRSFRLKTSPNFCSQLFKFLSASPLNHRAIRSCYNVCDPTVNSKDATVKHFCIFNLYYDMDIPKTTFFNNLCCSRRLPFEQISLKVPQHQWDTYPSSSRRKRNGFPLITIGEYPSIIINAFRRKVSRWFSFSFEPSQTICCTTNGPDRQISRQSELRAAFFITKLMQRRRMASFILYANSKHKITGTCKSFAGFLERLSNFWRSHQFATYSLSRHVKYCLLFKELNQQREERGFLPPLKGWVSTSSIG